MRGSYKTLTGIGGRLLWRVRDRAVCGPRQGLPLDAALAANTFPQSRAQGVPQSMLPRQLRVMAALLVSVTMSGLGASGCGLALPPQSANPQQESGESAAKEDPFAPMVKIQAEDYAKVRSQFRTKLTRKGPSPQPWSAAKPPAGVSEIEYVSGELRLKAWVNRPADGDRKRPAVLFLHGGFAFGAEDWDVSRSYRDAG